MAYIPGYPYDIFISYAHGDDREWIGRLVDRLKSALKQRLGQEAVIWIDDSDLRKSRDFTKEIPASLRSSAVFLCLPSPTYVASVYCVKEEVRIFQEGIQGKRDRFNSVEFANEKFALRCPLLPVEGNEHWELIAGATDIPFCDKADTFAVGTPQFDSSFATVTGELVSLLKRIRNHSTPVFLYPRKPGPDLLDAHTALAAELSAQSYRLLPDREVNLPGQLREAAISVFLLGEAYDDRASELADLASRQGKPWVVWCSPDAIQKGEATQIGFSKSLEQLDSATKTYLNASVAPGKLKGEVLSLLRSDTPALPAAQGKPRVYLIYNSRDRAEVGNAGQIMFHYRAEFHFDIADDPSQHTLRLTRSDGVLLVWGVTDEEWCTREFAKMVQSSGRNGTKGLCLFDPKETKIGVLEKIRQTSTGLYIAEEFGRFDPAHLETFFDPIRRRSQAGQV